LNNTSLELNAVTLIWYYVRKYEVTYLEDQVDLNPHPDGLMLLNEL